MPTAARPLQFVERVSQFAAILETRVPDSGRRATLEIPLATL